MPFRPVYYRHRSALSSHIMIVFVNTDAHFDNYLFLSSLFFRKVMKIHVNDLVIPFVLILHRNTSKFVFKTVPLTALSKSC